MHLLNQRMVALTVRLPDIGLLKPGHQIRDRVASVRIFAAQFALKPKMV